jgi:IS30 family transposase
MDIRSKHLSSEDRDVILAEHNRGSSQRLIGQLLHRPASTICRRKRKLVEGSNLYRFVHGKLVHLHWSPEQIAQRLRLMKPDDPSPGDNLCRDLRAATWRAEGGNDRGVASSEA